MVLTVLKLLAYKIDFWTFWKRYGRSYPYRWNSQKKKKKTKKKNSHNVLRYSFPIYKIPK